MALLDELVQSGFLKTPRIIKAFEKIKRIDFLPDELKDLAELNTALSIGYEQTISQPTVVAFMLEELLPKEGEKVLDVGFGSGWTTALLAEIVKDKGKVVGIELVSELFEFGRKNISKYDFIKKGRVELVLGDGSKEYEKEAPFDKILVSARAEKFFSAWKEQLRTGGRIVFPAGSSIFSYIKKSPDDFEGKEYPGFAFVPLLEK